MFPDEPDENQRAQITALAPEAAITTASRMRLELGTLYVFLQAGDAPQPRLLDWILPSLQGGLQVVTFDAFHEGPEGTALLMAPGANAPFLNEDERHYRRGAATSAFVEATAGSGLRERLLGWTVSRTPAEIRANWRHIGAPLAHASLPWALPVCVPSRVALGRPAAAGASVIICVKDKGHLTRQLVRQLLRLDERVLADVVIISNGTTNPYALSALSDLAEDSRVEVLSRPGPFNFSHLCNAGVAATRGKGPLLFLNDDIAPVSEDWLERMLVRLAAPGTGAVGALLLYPDERVQHAGIYLRLSSGAGHILRGAKLPEDDPLRLTAAARETTCLTGAALLVDRAAFFSVGGFDEALALSFQDLDLCLKLHVAGLRNVFEPRAILFHMESVSLKTMSASPAAALQKYHEWRLFSERWSLSFPQDPFYPAALDLNDESSRRLAPGGPWDGC